MTCRTAGVGGKRRESDEGSRRRFLSVLARHLDVRIQAKETAPHITCSLTCGTSPSVGDALQPEIDAGRLVRLLPTAGLPTVALCAAWPGR
jgi:hypothetical protein